MKIVVWRDTSDIDVMVDGEPATHRTYQNFRFGKVTSDRYRKEQEKRSAEEKERKANLAIISRLAKLGRVSINQMGQRMALWKYSSENSVSVIFESGTVVKTTWYAYRNGLVVDPSQKLAEEAMEQTVKDVWGRDRKEFIPNEDESDAYKRACGVSRRLDGCATSLRMYSMTAAEPIGRLLETLSKAATFPTSCGRKGQVSTECLLRLAFWQGQ